MTLLKTLRLGAATALLGVILPLPAAEYTLLIHESAAALARRDDAGEGPAYWAAYDRYAGELAGAGVLRGGSGLVIPTGGGPGTQIGGYFVIEVETDAEAAEWARRCPATVQGGRVELRRHLARRM